MLFFKLFRGIIIEKGAVTIDIFEAVKTGNLDRVKLLLKKGVDVNLTDSCRITALLYAVEHHHFNITKLLIKHGADVNIFDLYDWNVLDHTLQHNFLNLTLLFHKHQNRNIVVI